MISYLIIYTIAYSTLFFYLPILHEEPFAHNWFLKAIRHGILLFLSSHLSSFLWRQKFVSKSN